MPLVTGFLLAAALAQAAPAVVTGRLSGRVTAEGTNAPVAGARVMVFPMMRPQTPPAGPMSIPPQGTTDADGRFAFNGLTPGEYRIDVRKTGFASMQEIGTRPKTYAVGAGQSVDVAIVLQKGAVISGKIVDQKGEPVADVRVMALRRLNPPARTDLPPRLVPAPMQGPQQTNDIGEYRVTGLQPGEYFVAAVPRGMGFGGPPSASTGGGGGALTPTTTFYPGTAEPAGAQPITVVAGAEVSNIVFTVQSVPAYRISGIVVDENGAPVAHAMVMLTQDPRSGMPFIGPGGHAQTGDDGRFSIGDVTSGTWRVNASVPIVSGGLSTSLTGGVVGDVAGSSSSIGSTTSSTTWTVTNGGVTTTTTVSGPPLPPQEVVVGDADVKGVRVIARRPPTPQ